MHLNMKSDSRNRRYLLIKTILREQQIQNWKCATQKPQYMKQIGIRTAEINQIIRTEMVATKTRWQQSKPLLWQHHDNDTRATCGIRGLVNSEGARGREKVKVRIDLLTRGCRGEGVGGEDVKGGAHAPDCRAGAAHGGAAPSQRRGTCCGHQEVITLQQHWRSLPHVGHVPCYHYQS